MRALVAVVSFLMLSSLQLGSTSCASESGARAGDAPPPPEEKRPSRSTSAAAIDPNQCARGMYEKDPAVPVDVKSRGTFRVTSSTEDHTTGYELTLVEGDGLCTGLLVVWPGTLEPYRYPIEEAHCRPDEVRFTTTKQIAPQNKRSWRLGRHKLKGTVTKEGLKLIADPPMSELEPVAPRIDDGDVAAAWKNAVRYAQARACIDEQLTRLPILERRITVLRSEKQLYFPSSDSYTLLCDDVFGSEAGLVAVLRSKKETIRSALPDLVGGASFWSVDASDVPRRGHPLVKCLARMTSSGDLDADEVEVVLAAYPESQGEKLKSGALAWIEEQSDKAAARGALEVHPRWKAALGD